MATTHIGLVSSIYRPICNNGSIHSVESLCCHSYLEARFRCLLRMIEIRQFIYLYVILVQTTPLGTSGKEAAACSRYAGHTI